MNLEQEIEALKARLSKLEGTATVEAQPEEPKRPKGMPAVGQKYWCVTAWGDIDYNIWGDVIGDMLYWSYGNVYLTEEEAIHARDKHLALVEWQRLADGYEFTEGRNNWYLAYSTSGGFITDAICFYKYQGTIYFHNEEALKEAIQAMGHEKLKLILGVK